jgi:hypothetical protein
MNGLHIMLLLRSASLAAFIAGLAACSEQPPAQENSPVIQSTPAIPTARQADLPLAKTDTPPKTEAAPVAKMLGPEMPKDVSDFIEKREICDHFRGEEAYDEARGEFINNALKKNCTGTDADLKQLRNRHKDNQNVSNMLKKYEEKVEVAP